ncbi:hypothetical protein PPL_09351 [Heterostelium album PN500]|uniref:Uncharacterized protein n=1 Tax=Heterostelium pallidum (strain ATCC 26659 / Pp 5 / PN500) TaxID=670386 RepID=D3BLB9_HETP5|nr:hypothetical protein PPL_09351 [Heterostelium album PN500]EFA77853.1 hypothetical protein PPL_09351 [Heterostelium album PN500]|eukprot:XP_020429981.1 hypothetical protein PPL_09351 [Heterostelium album PN500]
MRALYLNSYLIVFIKVSFDQRLCMACHNSILISILDKHDLQISIFILFYGYQILDIFEKENASIINGPNTLSSGVGVTVNLTRKNWIRTSKQEILA